MLITVCELPLGVRVLARAFRTGCYIGDTRDEQPQLMYLGSALDALRRTDQVLEADGGEQLAWSKR